MELEAALAAPRVEGEPVTVSVPPRMLTLAPGIVAIDNLLSEPARERVLKFLQAPGWSFGWKSNSRKDTFSFWHKHFAGHRNGRKEEPYDCADELKTKFPLMFGFWQHLEKTIFKGQMLVRCYANAQSYGSDGSLHTDSKSPFSSTAVYYPHAEWSPDWAGETLVFAPDKADIVAAIYPRGNRLAIFPGNMPHVARGVARICPELRITLMFKVDRRDDQAKS